MLLSKTSCCSLHAVFSSQTFMVMTHLCTCVRVCVCVFVRTWNENPGQRNASLPVRVMDEDLRLALKPSCESAEWILLSCWCWGVFHSWNKKGSCCTYCTPHVFYPLWAVRVRESRCRLVSPETDAAAGCRFSPWK